MRLAGKVALVTGGAFGMGASECELVAKEGAKVAVADIAEAQGRDVVDRIAKAGGQARFVRLDVAVEDDWRAAVADVAGAYGKLDVLVNNAGISGGIEEDIMSSTAWDRLMDINAK